MSDPWFDAASRYNQTALAELLDGGADIDRRDDKGRTALFYVIAPFGGSPELYKWLVERGADVNIRDNSGDSALDHGWGAVSSALEANGLRWAQDFSFVHGYRIPGNRADDPSDFWGDWGILLSDGSDSDRDQPLSLSESAIDTEVVWLRLRIEERQLDSSSGALTLHGDHGGELVHVTLELLSPTRALLTWLDGIAGPSRLLLGRTRPPLRAT